MLGVLPQNPRATRHIAVGQGKRISGSSGITTLRPSILKVHRGAW